MRAMLLVVVTVGGMAYETSLCLAHRDDEMAQNVDRLKECRYFINYKKRV
jgi:hypothetical protein